MFDQPFNLARPLFAVAMVTASTIYAIAQQPPTPTRVRGTIEGIDGDLLAVHAGGWIESREDKEINIAPMLAGRGSVSIPFARACPPTNAGAALRTAS